MKAHLKAAATMLAPVAWIAGIAFAPEPYNWLISFGPFVVGLGMILLASYLALVEAFRA